MTTGTYVEVIEAVQPAYHSSSHWSHIATEQVATTRPTQVVGFGVFECDDDVRERTVAKRSSARISMAQTERRNSKQPAEANGAKWDSNPLVLQQK